MNKEELKAYKKTKRGNKVYPLLNRLMIDGILCFLCSLFLIISTIIMHDSAWFYFLGALLFIAGIFFVLMSFKFKKEELVKMKQVKSNKKLKVDKK